MTEKKKIEETSIFVDVKYLIGAEGKTAFYIHPYGVGKSYKRKEFNGKLKDGVISKTVVRELGFIVY